MVPLIVKMQQSFRKVDADVEMFRDNISLPNIARNLGFKSAEQEVTKVCKASPGFHLAKGDFKGELLERTMRAHMAGGPSIIFERDHHAHITHIREHPEETIQTIQTWDANALYPRCMKNEMPVGGNVIYYGPKPSYQITLTTYDDPQEAQKDPEAWTVSCR